MRQHAWIDAGAGFALGLVLYAAVAGRLAEVLPLLLLAAAIGAAAYAGGFRGILLPFAAPATPAGEIGFDDVGGHAAAKRELIEALDFVADPERARRLGVRPLRGILLVGPPGTGKTMLARAAAAYTRSAFVAASGSEFVEVFAGVGAQRVRALFKRARDLARAQGRRSAVIFIDELEVVGGKRGRHASHLEYDQTLNQLLVEMDGLSWDDEVHVVVIGATNRPDLLDEALLRPGRFDRVVQVGLPDLQERLEILRIHARRRPLADDVDLAAIARQTFGFAGAHLENLLNEAAILAWREGSPAIHQRHLVEAIDKVLLGERSPRRPSPEEKQRVAVHEAGHAVIAELLRPGSVASVTIAPRGAALGYVRHHQEGDRWVYTREQLEAEISVCLAGHAAEELLLGSASTGVAADFGQATALARRMVEAGMSPLGVVAPDVVPPRELHEAIRGILAGIMARVRVMLCEHRAAVQLLAAHLLARETVPGDDVRAALRGALGPAPAPAPPHP